MIKLILPLFILSLLCGCSENDSPVPSPMQAEEVNIWKLDSSISYANKFIMNMFTLDSTAYLLTPDLIRKYEEGAASGWYHRLPGDYWGHPYFSIGLTNDYYVTNYNDSSFSIKQTSSPVGDAIVVDIADIDSSIVAIGHLGFHAVADDKFVTAAIYEDSVGILIMEIKNKEIFSNVMNTYYLKWLLEIMGVPMNSLVEFTTVKVTDRKRDFFQNICKGFNNIIITTSHQSYTITAEGETHVLDMNLGDIVVYNDEIIFSTAEIYNSGRRSEYGIAISEDDGLTWSTITERNISFGPKQKCLENVNGEIIAYYNEQLHHYEKTEEGFSIKSIDNTGLEGNQITGVAYHRGKVIVATLSGLYYKDWDDFIEY